MESLVRKSEYCIKIYNSKTKEIVGVYDRYSHVIRDFDVSKAAIQQSLDTLCRFTSKKDNTLYYARRACINYLDKQWLIKEIEKFVEVKNPHRKTVLDLNNILKEERLKQAKKRKLPIKKRNKNQ